LAGAPDVRALWNHNADLPLGRTRNNTLRIVKDNQGLRIELKPPPTTWGTDASTSIRRGDVSGMSFAFAVNGQAGDVWEKGGADGVALRTIVDADLYEVSPVTFPAYPATQVMVRSVAVPDFESDSQVADEINERDADRAVVAARLQHDMDILRRR
jgi:HK97 family phage prohead protease